MHQWHDALVPLLAALSSLTRLEELALPPLVAPHHGTVAEQLLLMPQLHTLIQPHLTRHQLSMDDVSRIATNCTQPFKYRCQLNGDTLEALVTLSQSQCIIPNFAHLEVSILSNLPSADRFISHLSAFQHLTSLKLQLYKEWEEKFLINTYATLPSLTNLLVWADWCCITLHWLREWTSPQYLPSLHTVTIEGECNSTFCGLFGPPSPHSYTSAPPPTFPHLRLVSGIPAEAGEVFYFEEYYLLAFLHGILPYFPHITTLTLASTCDVWLAGGSWALQRSLQHDPCPLLQLPALSEVHFLTERHMKWPDHLRCEMKCVAQMAPSWMTRPGQRMTVTYQVDDIPSWDNPWSMC